MHNRRFRIFLMSLAPLLLLAGGAPSQTPRSQLVLRIVPACRECPVGKTPTIYASYNLTGDPILVHRSTLSIADEHCTPLFVANADVFDFRKGHIPPSGGTTNRASEFLQGRLAALPAGDYYVTLQIDDVVSNSAPVHLGAPRTPSQSVLIEPLMRHCEPLREPELVVHYTDTKSASLSALWAQAYLLIDGVSLHRTWFMWGGSDGMDPDFSWGTVVHLDEYGPPHGCVAKAGRHQVQLMMGGSASNVLTLDLPADVCQSPPLALVGRHP